MHLARTCSFSKVVVDFWAENTVQSWSPCEYWPKSQEAGLWSPWSTRCPKGWLMTCTTVAWSYPFDLTFIMMWNSVQQQHGSGNMISWKAPQHHFFFFFTIRTIQLNLVHNETNFLHHIQYGCKLVLNLLCGFMAGKKKALSQCSRPLRES